MPPRTRPKNRRSRRVHSEWHTYPIEWKQIDNEENILVGYASVWGFPADDHGDVVRQGAFRKTIQERVKAGKVPLLDSHIYDSAHTLGTVIRAEEDERGLKIWAKLSTSSDVQGLKMKLVEGHVSKLSIGFDVVKESFGRDPQTGQAVRFLDEVKLYEISVVPIPALDRATILSVKAVVPYQDLALANRERPWDSDEALARVRQWAGGGESLENMNWNRYRRAFLWFDSENPEQITSYKLPIADYIDGKLMAVPRGIFAVAGALQGSRGGVDIPENDRERIRNQVNRYYRKMRDEFDDRSIVAPWEVSSKSKKQMLDVSNLSDMELEDLLEEIRELWLSFDQPLNREHFESMGVPVLREMINRNLDIAFEDSFVMGVMDMDENMMEQNRLGELETITEYAFRLNQQKAGSRHNKQDRKNITEAIEALMNLLSPDELSEFMSAKNDEDKGNNKPHNVQPYNRDPDYEKDEKSGGDVVVSSQTPEASTHTTTERYKQRMRLQELKMKQLKGACE